MASISTANSLGLKTTLSLLMNLLTIKAAKASSVEIAINERMPSLIWGIPLPMLLLAMALLSLIAPDFWHHHFGKIAAGWALAAVALLFLNFGVQRRRNELPHILQLQYTPLMPLFFAGYSIAGCSYMGGSSYGPSIFNIWLLRPGTWLASLTGYNLHLFSIHATGLPAKNPMHGKMAVAFGLCLLTSPRRTFKAAGAFSQRSIKQSAGASNSTAIGRFKKPSGAASITVLALITTLPPRLESHPGQVLRLLAFPDETANNLLLFLLTGGMSSNADNAPLYLQPLILAGGDAQSIAAPSSIALFAVSGGTAYKGANSCIDSAPHSKVKSIQLALLSFLGYRGWSFRFLEPCFLLGTSLFFAQNKK